MWMCGGWVSLTATIPSEWTCSTKSPKEQKMKTFVEEFFEFLFLTLGGRLVLFIAIVAGLWTYKLLGA
jgi:hypothetical protein